VALATIISSATSMSSGAAALSFFDLDTALSLRGIGGPVDVEVVVLALLAGGRLAAPGFEYRRQLPQFFQFVAVGEIGKAGGQRLLVEQRLDVVVAQVGDHRHAFDDRVSWPRSLKSASISR
jgi:hypothetical protein